MPPSLLALTQIPFLGSGDPLLGTTPLLPTSAPPLASLDTTSTPPKIEVDGWICGDDEEIFANKTSHSGRRHHIGGGRMAEWKLEQILDLRFEVRLGVNYGHALFFSLVWETTTSFGVSSFFFVKVVLQTQIWRGITNYNGEKSFESIHFLFFLRVILLSQWVHVAAYVVCQCVRLTTM